MYSAHTVESQLELTVGPAVIALKRVPEVEVAATNGAQRGAILLNARILNGAAATNPKQNCSAAFTSHFVDVQLLLYFHHTPPPRLSVVHEECGLGNDIDDWLVSARSQFMQVQAGPGIWL